MTSLDSAIPHDGPVAEDRAHAIRDRLRDAIVDRRLAPGAKLAEGEIGALFGVSRTIARAALQMLAFEGLVRIEKNRGAFVANPSPEEARAVFAARRLVEPGIVAAVSTRITAPGLARLHRHLAEEVEQRRRHGPSARRTEIRISGAFHLSLAHLAGNAILARFMGELVARSSLVIALYGRSGASSCGHDEHAAIVAAIAAGDSAAAEALVVRHIDHLEADLDLRAGETRALRDALDGA